MAKYSTVGIVLLIALCGCDRETIKTNQVEILDRGLVHEVSRGTTDGIHDIQVWSLKDTKLEAMANMSIFEEFRPGLTFEKAIQKFGRPDTTRTAKNETEFQCYDRTNAILAVAKERYHSFGGRDFWTIWAFPTNGGFSLSSVVSSNVLALVELPRSPFQLVLRDATPGQESLWLTVSSNGVSKIRWIRWAGQ